RRKATLGALALLSAAGAAAAAAARDPLLLGLIALVGMLNGMGRDRGAVLILEQALLPATTDDRGRTRVFAVYNVLQDVGHALGRHRDAGEGHPRHARKPEGLVEDLRIVRDRQPGGRVRRDGPAELFLRRTILRGRAGRRRAFLRGANPECGLASGRGVAGGE